ncbi:MAG TPA: hypothetical protein VLV31_12705, partial [Candidatus Acidoferrales bacterium]|nr:hypothetical protein [Candidatus Acidoferrales bacterium]
KKRKRGWVRCGELVFQFFDSFRYAFELILEVALVFLKPLDFLFLSQVSTLTISTHISQHLLTCSALEDKGGGAI